MHFQITLLALVPLFSTLTIAYSRSRRANGCPEGVTYVRTNDKEYCCPGSPVISNNDAYCCIGASIAIPSLTFCPGFPFCSGTTAPVAVPTSFAAPSCRTTIPFSATDYESRAAAAAGSMGGATSETSTRTTGVAGSMTGISDTGGASSPTNTANTGDASSQTNTSPTGGAAAASETFTGGAVALPAMTGGPERWVRVGVMGAMGVLGAL